jgi:hypothetical protein
MQHESWRRQEFLMHEAGRSLPRNPQTDISQNLILFYFFSNAGFFLWIDLSKCLNPRIVETQGEWAAELDLSKQLQGIGVDMSSGYAYHNETPGWFRVIFSMEMEVLGEGLSRFVTIPSRSIVRPHGAKRGVL